MRHPSLRPSAAIVVLVFGTLVVTRQSFAAAPPEPVPLVALRVEFGESDAQQLSLVGSTARRQLIVTGEFAGRGRDDVSRDIEYLVDPPGVVQVDARGVVRPIANGVATIRFRHPQHPLGTESAPELQVEVKQFGGDPPVHFVNDVVPIFTKLGCNGGGCHGKSGGQNGFRLSLLGFEPPEDYVYLLKEARGRRLSLAAPAHSLLLAKATGEIPHGGGQRMERDDPNYALLHRWIAEGAAYGPTDAPHVVGIEVTPASRVLQPGVSQQLLVMARYSNGRVEDVTRLAQFDANVPEMAEIDSSGLVQLGDETGDVAVMVRYQSCVDVFRGMIPLGAPVGDLPPPHNLIDQLVFKKLRVMGLPPSATCNDSTFLRRVSLDITGRLPTVGEYQAFMSDSGPDKRERCIDRLVDSGAYADLFANKWSAILRNRRTGKNPRRSTFALHSWIRDSLHHNLPYDEFVASIVAGSGDTRFHPAVAWYREVNEVHELVEDTAQLFLGQRLQCARCHHHPHEAWSRRDYYSFAAFFSRLGRKADGRSGEIEIFHKRGVAVATNPKDNQPVRPAGLGSAPREIPANEDPRQHLVDWMTGEQNPYFAESLVNRYWKHFFGRGLVDPEDDLRQTNPATNPELLSALSDAFVASGYDIKWLVRTICNSQVYQFSSIPNQFNASDRQNYSRYYPKRMMAEVLLDAIDQVTEGETVFAGMPPKTRAIQLPDTGFDLYFFNVFGRPQSETACECERTGDANLAQSLHLMNSAEIHGKIHAESGRARRLATEQDRPVEQRIRELYRCALTREPTDVELTSVTEYMSGKRGEDGSGEAEAFEDVVWTLLNTKEFLFNH